MGRVVLLMLGELSYECGASCLEVSFMWVDLSWGELSVILTISLFERFCHKNKYIRRMIDQPFSIVVLGRCIPASRAPKD